MHKPPVVPVGRWLDWWFAARWRGLITWLVLAGISAAAIDSRHRDWMDFVTRRLSMISRDLVGYSPPASILEMSGVFGLMCWFQPVCLRLGVVRSALWMFIYITVGLAIQGIYNWMGDFNEALYDAVLLPPMLGIPALAAIGVRTRLWISPCAAILSSIATYLFCTEYDSLLKDVLVANAPYATLMLYATKRTVAPEAGYIFDKQTELPILKK